MHVVKSDGRKEQFDINKFHLMVEEACKDLVGVSASQVEMNSNIQFYDGIHTKDIQKILIRSAADLITLDTPNYQYVAARLLAYGLYKEVFGQFEPLSLIEVMDKNIAYGVYDSEIRSYYSDNEWDELDKYIKHKRDFEYEYAGIKKMVDTYLVQNRTTGKIYETPQIGYMLVAAVGFHKYPQNIRLSYVKKFYDAASTGKLNLPTPILAGVRTPKKQYASCVLIDVDDTLDSIFNSVGVVGKYTASRAGIGLNFGRIRAIKDQVRSGEVEHTGVVPYLKIFEAATKATSQNGIRGGGGTVHFPLYHKEIEDIIVLKNNKGTEDNRVRKLDYSIGMTRLFYERYINGENISLFSPKDVPGLLDVFGTSDFDALYVKYENDPNVPKKVVSAIQLIDDLIIQRMETGRIYITNMDHINENGMILDHIYMSNLCQEITLHTKPIQFAEDTEGRIATCILAAINLGKIRHLDDLRELANLSVRFLDELIDYQEYPFVAAELYTKEYRTLGVGYIGLAHYLAKNHMKYGSPESLELLHKTTEAFAYYLTETSMELAKEKGAAPKFNRTRYSKGQFPIDTYRKSVDNLFSTLYLDWDALKAKVAQYGMRNCTLMAQMPSESCLKWNHKVKINGEFKDFHEICTENGIDWRSIEQNDAIGWYEFPKKSIMDTQDGPKMVDKIYYNGMRETISLELENGKTIVCTPNHQFLVNDPEQGNVWKSAYELTEDDDIVEFQMPNT